MLSLQTLQTVINTLGNSRGVRSISSFCIPTHHLHSHLIYWTTFPTRLTLHHTLHTPPLIHYTPSSKHLPHCDSLSLLSNPTHSVLYSIHGIMYRHTHQHEWTHSHPHTSIVTIVNPARTWRYRSQLIVMEYITRPKTAMGGYSCLLVWYSSRQCISLLSLFCTANINTCAYTY